MTSEIKDTAGISGLLLPYVLIKCLELDADDIATFYPRQLMQVRKVGISVTVNCGFDLSECLIFWRYIVGFQ